MGQKGARVNVIRAGGSTSSGAVCSCPEGSLQLSSTVPLNGLGAESPLTNVPSFLIPLSHAWRPWPEPGVSQAQYPKEVRKVHERLQA